MNTYRVSLRLTPTNWAVRGRRALDSNALLETITDVAAHGIRTTEQGQLNLDVTLNRTDPEAALNDLIVVAQQFGYALVNGEIRKLVGLEVESAILSGLGSGALGALSNDWWVVGMAVLAGGIAGWIVGSTMKRVEVVYEVRPNLQGGWTFMPRLQSNGETQTGPALA